MRHMVSFRHFHFNPRLQEGDDVFSLMFSDSKRISIHASEKEATRWLPRNHHVSPFQSTPPRRRRRIVRNRIDSLINNFNPRLREGGDFYISDTLNHSSIFQSTPPRRRRLYSLRITFIASEFQSTPPRRRRPGHRSLCRCPFSISIHASKKEATLRLKILSLYWNFTPRLREGGDLIKFRIVHLFLISIHASEKEATRFCKSLEFFIVFQSTPPRRRRRGSGSYDKVTLRFQSTPPRRRRQ